MEVGVEFFCRWGVERRGGVEILFRYGVEKEVGSRIFSSIIEERGKLHNKLSLWCKSFIRNLFKRSSHCLPQQYLIIILVMLPFALFYYIAYSKIRQNLK